MHNRWFQIPGLHTSYSGVEKKASWLELFYDLVYVAAFIQLGNGLSEKISMGNFLGFAGLFVPLWLTWTGFSYYSNRFNIDDSLHRAGVFMQMFAVAAMAIAAPRVLKGEVHFFGLSIAFAHLLVALWHLRSYIQNTESRAYCVYWGGVFFLSAALWAGGCFVPKPFVYYVWSVGALGVFIASFLPRARVIAEELPSDMEHIAERYGLLTLIVLGESFVKVITSINSDGEYSILLQAFFALLITCSLWWIYFDDVAGSEIKKGRFTSQIWIWSHLPLQLSIIAVGVAIKKASGFNLDEPAPAKYAWLLCGTLALAMLSTAAVDTVSHRRQSDLNESFRHRVRGISGIFFLLLAAASQTMDARWLLALITFICFFQIFFDMLSSPQAMSDEELERSAVQIAEVAKKDFKAASGNLEGGEPVRKGVPSELKKDLFFFLMEGSWGRIWLVLFFIYLLVNVFFAGLFMLEPASISGVENPNMLDAFYFSVQTMSTIGYGVLSPGTAYGNLIVTLEAAVGLILVALATGLMFARAARPSARIIFSDKALIHKINGKEHLVLRIGNARGNDIVEARVTANALIDEITDEGDHFRRVVELKLVRSESPFFKLTWTIMHLIDKDSPVNKKLADGSLRSIMLTVAGHDATYSGTVFDRYNYNADQIIRDMKFKDVMHSMPDGRFMIDYDSFHEIEPIPEVKSAKKKANTRKKTRA